MKTGCKAPRWLAALAISGALLAACGGTDGVTVFAAASLAEAFPEIAAAPTEFSFGGSSGLVDQLAGGAPADVFASADSANMERALAENLIVGEPILFAINELVLITPPDNPARITGLDSSLIDAKLVMCAPEVPCGRASSELAQARGVELQPVSEELSVTDVLGKVTAGEADAGLVYATDAQAAGASVHRIEISGAADHQNEYWIGLVAGGDEVAGQEFIDRVSSPAGQEVLSELGFGAP